MIVLPVTRRLQRTRKRSMPNYSDCSGIFLTTRCGKQLSPKFFLAISRQSLGILKKITHALPVCNHVTVPKSILDLLSINTTKLRNLLRNDSHFSRSHHLCRAKSAPYTVSQKASPTFSTVT